MQCYRAQVSSSATKCGVSWQCEKRYSLMYLSKFELSNWESLNFQIGQRKGKAMAALSQGSVRYSPMHTLHCPRPITCHKCTFYFLINVNPPSQPFCLKDSCTQTCSTHSLVKPPLDSIQRNPKQRMCEKSLAENVREILSRECMRNP